MVDKTEKMHDSEAALVIIISQSMQMFSKFD